MIYCQSPGGDTAASLSDMALYTTYIYSPQGDNATANFHDTRRNDNEGNKSTDIRIRIRINLEFRIWIPDHCLLRLDALVEVCTLSAVEL